MERDKYRMLLNVSLKPLIDQDIIFYLFYTSFLVMLAVTIVFR